MRSSQWKIRQLTVSWTTSNLPDSYQHPIYSMRSCQMYGLRKYLYLTWYLVSLASKTMLKRLNQYTLFYPEVWEDCTSCGQSSFAELYIPSINTFRTPMQFFYFTSRVISFPLLTWIGSWNRDCHSQEFWNNNALSRPMKDCKTIY